MFKSFKKIFKTEPKSMSPVDRNLKGKELEKEGKIDEAMSLYWENVNENFEGSHPYNRLAVIYRKQKDCF
ncbi:hypothetical protein ACM26V_09295 [Salipaludibacillus sp. HK11]|uniref:hypothetical protein n=1 Tax=Salipaludibacillus sp. HK11 TaxID=3394320 RepID=UPI0039FD896A